MKCDGACSECGTNCRVEELADAALDLDTERDDSHEWHRMFQEAVAEVAELKASLPSIQARAHGMGQESAREEIDALRAEVTRLRAAIEPTVATMTHIRAALRYKANWSDELIEAILTAINARAGEVSAPGSSMRLTREKLTNLIADALSRADALEDGAVDAHHAAKIIAAALGEP